MWRRKFLGVLGGAVAAWSVPARAQQSARLPTIGFLGPSTFSVARERIAAFEGRLRELSRIKGQTVALERLDLLRELVPGLRRLAILGNVENAGASREMHECHSAARGLGLEVAIAPIRRGEDIGPAFDAVKGHTEALYVAGDALVNTNRDRINEAAITARLPTMHGFREIVEAGGLVSYAPSFLEQFRRAADYVDKILRGSKPADIPVEQPTRFELAINLKTARAIGLELPPTLLARADEVIE
jgi:putative ABC transport system substrate-binding protein